MDQEIEVGLKSLIGQVVVVFTSGNHYKGLLTAVNFSNVRLTTVSVGTHDVAGWKHSRDIVADYWVLNTAHIESFGVLGA